MVEHFETVVIGIGGVGSAALYQLAIGKNSVLGLDPHPPGHVHGSSHGETRVIRQAYFEHPDYVPLLLRAYELWEQLEKTTHGRLLVQAGLLQVGPADGVVLKGVREAADLHGLYIESMSAEQIEKRYPQFQIPSTLSGVFEPTAGYLLVEKCVQAHVMAAQVHGAQVRREHVARWQTKGDGFLVETSRNRYTADALIVTAGPWAGELLPRLSDHLSLRRTHQHWFPKPNSLRYETEGGCPVYLFETDMGIFYGFPSLDGATLKVAEHGIGTEVKTTPELADAGVDVEDQSRVAEFLARHLPEVAGMPVRHEPCFYTMSPDGHFYVGPHPENPRLLIAAGLSGHGFKFTPVLGQALADLALEGKTDLPIGFLSPGRVSP